MWQWLEAMEISHWGGGHLLDSDSCHPSLAGLRISWYDTYLGLTDIFVMFVHIRPSPLVRCSRDIVTLRWPDYMGKVPLTDLKYLLESAKKIIIHTSLINVDRACRSAFLQNQMTWMWSDGWFTALPSKTYHCVPVEASNMQWPPCIKSIASNERDPEYFLEHSDSCSVPDIILSAVEDSSELKSLWSIPGKEQLWERWPHWRNTRFKQWLKRHRTM